MEWFLTILKDYLGPQSDSGKMLVIDGEVYNLPAVTSPYFDYYIAQAYSVSGGTPSPTAGQSESNMEYRLSQIVSRYASYMTEEEVTNRFIVTENMESAINALDGGYYWTTRDGVRQDKKVCPSLLGMAKWGACERLPQGRFRRLPFRRRGREYASLQVDARRHSGAESRAELTVSPF